MHDFMSVTSLILVIGTIKVKKRYAMTNNTPLSASGYRQPSEEEERNQSVGLIDRRLGRISQDGVLGEVNRRLTAAITLVSGRYRAVFSDFPCDVMVAADLIPDA